jgi:hypothetical protein
MSVYRSAKFAPERAISARFAAVGMPAGLDAELVALGVLHGGEVVTSPEDRRAECFEPADLVGHAGGRPQVEVQLMGPPQPAASTYPRSGVEPSSTSVRPGSWAECAECLNPGVGAPCGRQRSLGKGAGGRSPRVRQPVNLTERIGAPLGRAAETSHLLIERIDLPDDRRLLVRWRRS